MARFSKPLIILVILIELVLLAVTDSYSNTTPRRPKPENQRYLITGEHDTNPANDVIYQKVFLSLPRPLMLHSVTFQLSSVDEEISRGNNPQNGFEATAQTTLEFARQSGALFAVNASYFKPKIVYPSWENFVQTGDPLNISGQVIINKQQVSAPEPSFPMLCFHEHRVLILPYACPSNTVNAVSGKFIFLAHKLPIAHSSSAKQPRTFVLVSSDGHNMVIGVIDGRQPGYSEGVTYTELGEIALSEFENFDPAWGLTLDGGGSSTLVIRNNNGEPVVANSPIHNHKPLHLRPVGVNLGFTSSKP